MIQSIAGLPVRWPYVNGGCCLALVDGEPGGPAGRAAQVLSPAEKDEGKIKSSPAAYRAWLLGRLAAKAAAADFWHLPPERVEIFRNPDGRPILRLPGESTGQVSISHTAGAAAAVVGSGPDGLGVDLERLDRSIDERAWHWAFSDDERHLAENVLRTGFPPRLSLWCAKEAAGKACGLGLLNNLARVRVTAADWTAGLVKVSLSGPEKAEVTIRLIVCGPYLTALTGAI